MRILYLCHRIPYPPDKGDKIRAFHQVRAIAAHHEIDVFTLADDGSGEAERRALGAYCSRLTVVPLNPRLARLRALPFLPTRTPLTVPYFRHAELRREIRKAIAARSYDRIFVYCSAMSQYVDGVAGIPTITDFVDVDSDKWKQYAGFAPFPLSAVYGREARALREYERRVCRNSACVVVTTEREAALAREIAPGTRVHVVSNGVDTQYFQPAAGTADAADLTIGFTGDMSYFPNEQAVTYFAREVFPLVRAALPTARFLIVGRNPTRNVCKLRDIAGVAVTGFVPDIRLEMAHIRVAVAPFSIAAGIQNKILEAMACGIPVVATPRAVQGLTGYTAGAVEVATDGEEIAARIVALLRDGNLARARGMEGRRRVAADYSWERSMDRLLYVLQNPAATDSGERHAGAGAGGRTQSTALP